MRTIKCLIPLAVALVAAPASSEELTTKDILDRLSSSNPSETLVWRLYIDGMTGGLIYANGYQASVRDRPLFCQPSKLSITQEQAIDILKTYVAKDPRMERAPLGLSLLYAMIYTFPCSAEQRIEKPSP